MTSLRGTGAAKELEELREQNGRLKRLLAEAELGEVAGDHHERRRIANR